MHAVQATDADPIALRDIALAAARAGASYVASRAADIHALTWETKSPADFVSEVDREAESRVSALIRHAMPQATLLGEEFSPDADVSTGVAVVTDPLDGTTNFLHGFPWFATSVGILVNGAATAGAIVNAATGETFVAALGHGAFRVTTTGMFTPVAVSRTQEPIRALIGTGFPFKDASALPRYQAQFASIAMQTSGMRRPGAAALDLCDVACGRFDAFWELELAPWDMAAGMLIVREAGGRVTDFDGHDIPVARGPVVASNNVLHNWFLTALREPQHLAPGT